MATEEGEEVVEEFNVEVTVAAQIDADALVDLTDALSSAGAAASFTDDTYTIALTAEGADVFDAQMHARRLLGDFEIPEERIVRMTTMTIDELEREVTRPTYPEVVGIAEIAERLGVSKQRASQVARTAAFPKPYAELASGPVWFLPNVKRFIEEWERKPGRPRKERAPA